MQWYNNGETWFFPSMNSYQLDCGMPLNFCVVSRAQWQVTANLHSTDETLYQKPRC